MNKNIFLTIASLALLSACSQTETVETADADAIATGPEPIAFGTYTGGATGTRAQQTGIMTDIELRSTGFGVFAYHTNGTSYNSASDKPNFMWNQEVTYDAPKWSYTPLKYWPNEFGTNAKSDHQDKLSFFAYAPYVEASTDGTLTESPTPTEGITTISPNNATGDPIITYAAAADPANSVDLLWGVNDTYTTTGSGYTGPTAAEWTGTAGEPYLNMDKMPIDKNVKFTFKHALTRLGISIQGMFDKVNNTSSLDDVSEAIKADSKVVVEQITISGSFRLGGKLSLNNTTANTALWSNYQNTRAASDQSTITFSADGSVKKNSGLGTSLADRFKYVDQKVSEYAANTGVDEERRDLLTGNLTSADRNYYMFVPEESGSDAQTTVTIKYHVITDDSALNGGKIDITNEITQSLDHGALDFSSGKANELNLVLGLTSVKMEASVTDWPNTATEADVDLPINK